MTGSIGEWDGKKVTSILFSEDKVVPLNLNPVGPGSTIELLFDTHGLILDSSRQYVAYLYQAGGSLAMPANTDPNSAGGYAVATATWGTFNFPSPIGNCEYGLLTCWDVNAHYGMGGLGGDNDVFIKLNSSPLVATIPEPETYAMLLAGLELLGFTARRRK